ncbi:hypothetical protein NEOLEDRAFT_1149523 [Neolentinus lepideus HHB14362 ss-1]|uniref:Uncharacterized protein n=1 Tax=Neolentinus lepideus HHB14362 ss-1 TaxID=1314782 RepID=A0A165R3E4_9AGAM|nr:hypothetical protein NEOLEDRAFT_1149523 [Neolentinus lepideus HHB14362 ss-1]
MPNAYSVCQITIWTSRSGHVTVTSENPPQQPSCKLIPSERATVNLHTIDASAYSVPSCALHKAQYLQHDPPTPVHTATACYSVYKLGNSIAILRNKCLIGYHETGKDQSTEATDSSEEPRVFLSQKMHEDKTRFLSSRTLRKTPFIRFCPIWFPLRLGVDPVYLSLSHCCYDKLPETRCEVPYFRSAGVAPKRMLRGFSVVYVAYVGCTSVTPKVSRFTGKDCSHLLYAPIFSLRSAGHRLAVQYACYVTRSQNWKGMGNISEGMATVNGLLGDTTVSTVSPITSLASLPRLLDHRLPPMTGQRTTAVLINRDSRYFRTPSRAPRRIRSSPMISVISGVDHALVAMRRSSTANSVQRRHQAWLVKQ